MSTPAEKARAAALARLNKGTSTASGSSVAGGGVEDDGDSGQKGMSVGLRIFLVFVVLSMTLPTLWMAYTFLFPNYPPSLSPSDTAKVQSVFFGGSPAVVLCENSTTLALAGPAAVSLARELGIPSYRLDCTAKLGGGKFTTFERLSVEPWNPAAFVVANGRKVQQLPPGFTEERVLQRLAKSLVPRIKAKHTRVDNSVDLNRCLGQAGQACILVYNSKPKSVTAGEIAGAVATHRTSVIALLDANTRTFRSPSSPILEGFFREEVAAAKAAATAAAPEGGKGTVLIALRRVGAKEAGGGSGNILSTIRAAGGATVTTADFTKVLGAQKQALEALKSMQSASEGKTGSQAAEAAADLALARDEALQKLGSVLVSKDALLIDRPPPKRKAPTGGEGEGEGEGGGEERSGGGGPTPAPTPELSQEEMLARQRAAEAESRRRMAEEEASSPHVAHASEEEEMGGGGGGGGGEEEEAGLDLDGDEL